MGKGPKSMTVNELIAYRGQLEAQGKTLSSSKEFAKVYNLLENNPMYKLIQTLQGEIIGLDRQLDQLTSLGLTDEEKEAFLQKAIQQVQPYYDRKSTEIQAQLDEGTLRTAEDQLLLIRGVEEETAQLLQQYDLSTAETEEEFADRLGALTAQTEDQIESKQYDWRQRMENVKFGQIQKGIFSSGIGKKKRTEYAEEEGRQIGAIQERASEQQTELERNKSYDIERIRLAREASQQRRIRQIGTPEETDRIKQEALDVTGGITRSAAGITERRQEAGLPNTLQTKLAFTDLEEKRREAVESRKLELQEDELAIRDQTYDRQREKILAERARKASQLGTYGVF